MTSTIRIPLGRKAFAVPNHARLAEVFAAHLDLRDNCVTLSEREAELTLAISGATPTDGDDAAHLYLSCAGITHTTHHETPTALAARSLPRWARRRVLLRRREVRTHGL